MIHFVLWLIAECEQHKLSETANLWVAMPVPFEFCMKTDAISSKFFEVTFWTSQLEWPVFELKCLGFQQCCPL